MTTKAAQPSQAQTSERKRLLGVRPQDMSFLEWAERLRQQVRADATLHAQLREAQATIETLRNGLDRLMDYIDAMEAKQSTKNDNAMFIDARCYYGLKCEAQTVREALPRSTPAQRKEES